MLAVFPDRFFLATSVKHVTWFILYLNVELDHFRRTLPHISKLFKLFKHVSPCTRSHNGSRMKD